MNEEDNLMHMLQTGRTIEQHITDTVFKNFGGLAKCEKDHLQRGYIFSVRAVFFTMSCDCCALTSPKEFESICYTARSHIEAEIIKNYVDGVQTNQGYYTPPSCYGK